MRRTLLVTLLLLALLPARADAHTGVRSVTHTETVAAGPYRLELGFAEWPLRALRSNWVVIRPEGGIGGTRVEARLIHLGMGQMGAALLSNYPGVPDAWVLVDWAFPHAGDWQWEFSVDGPQGRGTGSTQVFAVGGPPGMPLALGWLIGLFPLWGLLTFIVREVRRAGRLGQSAA